MDRALTMRIAAFLPLVLALASGPVLGSSPQKTGTFNIRRSGQPHTLNPIIADGHDAVDIQFLVIEPLLQLDARTGDWVPALARSWRRLPDGKTYEFELRPGALWSDGKPVTAEDVKFSFEVYFHPGYPAAHMRPYYEGIERVEILSPRKVRFVARNRYFGNFISSAGLPVLPRHVYGDPKKGPFIHDTLVGSGPYRFASWRKGARITLERNPLWWGTADPRYAGMHNPERISFRFVGDDNIAIEMLKKGQLDFMDLGPDSYARRTSGPGWGTMAFKRAVRNRQPKALQFIGWNLKHPIFRDRQVRRALAHLMDRKLMIGKFFHGFSLPATGPWYLQSPYADPSVRPIEFDPGRALDILREAGWRDGDRDGILEKRIDGRRVDLRFTVLTPDKGAERYLTVFREDAKRAGADISVRYLDWTALGGLVDERRFDAVVLNDGGGLVDFDPKPLWHSSSDFKGGRNVMGFRDPRVDRLIDRARNEPRRSKRIPLLREVYRIIAREQPCLFLFNDDAIFYAHSARVGMPAPTFDYDIGLRYWWVKAP